MSNKETKLEKEAKAYKNLKRKKPSPTKYNAPLTSRRYFAGQAMAVLMSQSKSRSNLEDIKREAYEIADFMMED